MSLTLKTIAINAFVAWRMFQRQDRLETIQSFKSIENYRNSLRKMQATADFMCAASKELLS